MNALDTSLPPQAIEAEQSVIGGLLIDGAKAFDRITGLVSDGDFFRDDHRRIFRHAARLYGAGKPVDIVTITESIDSSSEREQTGGMAYLAEIATNTTGAANIRRYAEIVREKAMLRQLQAVALQTHAACANPAGRTVEQIAAEAEGGMLACVDRFGGEPKALADVFSEALAFVDERCNRGDELGGLVTGFLDFDRLTGGLEPGALVIGAARPSVGKTIFGGNVAEYVSRQGKSVLFFTLEMSAREIGMRLLSARSKVSVHSMRSGTNDQNHWRRMSDQATGAERQRLFIDDKAGIGVNYVRAKARRIKRQHGLDLVVIDYLGLMQGTGQNRTQEIGSISRGLKALAKELSVPILALAQLNRGVEGRPDKRPMISDLRDSGEIEQDADIVVLLHRESLYSSAPEWQGIAELLVRKNRNGPLGDVTLHYLPEEMSFANHSGPSIRQQISASAKAMKGSTAPRQNIARGLIDD